MPELSKLTDEKVVEITRTEDKEAYVEIVKRYQDKLLRYAKYLLNDESLPIENSLEEFPLDFFPTEIKLFKQPSL